MSVTPFTADLLAEWFFDMPMVQRMPRAAVGADQEAREALVDELSSEHALRVQEQRDHIMAMGLEKLLLPAVPWVARNKGTNRDVFADFDLFRSSQGTSPKLFGNLLRVWMRSHCRGMLPLSPCSFLVTGGMCGSECTDKHTSTFTKNVHFGHSHICDTCAEESLSRVDDLLADHVPMSLVSSYDMTYRPDEESADPFSRVIACVFVSDATALRARHRAIVAERAQQAKRVKRRHQDRLRQAREQKEAEEKAQKREVAKAERAKAKQKKLEAMSEKDRKAMRELANEKRRKQRAAKKAQLEAEAKQKQSLQVGALPPLPPHSYLLFRMKSRVCRRKMRGWLLLSMLQWSRPDERLNLFVLQWTCRTIEGLVWLFCTQCVCQLLLSNEKRPILSNQLWLPSICKQHEI